MRGGCDKTFLCDELGMTTGWFYTASQLFLNQGCSYHHHIEEMSTHAHIKVFKKQNCLYVLVTSRYLDSCALANITHF